MRKIITTIFILFTLTTYATAVEFYNTAGDVYQKEPTNRGYIIFDSEEEYTTSKVFMEECHIFPTEEEVEFILSKYAKTELSYVLTKNHIKPGAYIVEFIIEDIPGNDYNCCAFINYKYIE